MPKLTKKKSCDMYLTQDVLNNRKEKAVQNCLQVSQEPQVSVCSPFTVHTEILGGGLVLDYQTESVP